MRAAIYARVSTTDQNNAMQITELQAYAAARGWTVAQIYEDQRSGACSSRPAFDRMLQDARQRRFDAVLVWKLDRFGRSMLNCITTIQELESLGIRFIATTQGIDTDQSNPMAKLLLHLIGAFAEFERDIIRERVSAGMKAARDRGVRVGRPNSIFSKTRALQMRSEGMKIRAIATACEVSVATIHRLLKQEERNGTRV